MVIILICFAILVISLIGLFFSLNWKKETFFDAKTLLAYNKSLDKFYLVILSKLQASSF